MSKATINTHDKVSELANILVDRESAAYAAGYMTSMLIEVLDLLPKTKRQAYLAQVEQQIKSRYTTKVRNLMSGAEVEITLDQVGGPCDPSTERYWSM